MFVEAFTWGLGVSLGASIGLICFAIMFAVVSRVIDFVLPPKSQEFEAKTLNALHYRNILSERLLVHVAQIAADSEWARVERELGKPGDTQ